MWRQEGLELSDMYTHFWSLFRDLWFRVLVLGLLLYQGYLEGGLLRQKAGLQPQFLFDAVHLGCGPTLGVLCVVYTWVPVHVMGRGQGPFSIAIHLVF